MRQRPDRRVRAVAGADWPTLPPGELANPRYMPIGGAVSSAGPRAPSQQVAMLGRFTCMDYVWTGSVPPALPSLMTSNVVRVSNALRSRVRRFESCRGHPL